MGTLHLVPTYSAGGSMKRALLDAGVEDAVLSMPDDLSCGPIAAGDIAERVAWWGQFYEEGETEARLSAFWQTLATTPDRLIVWFSRTAAQELAFFHAYAEQLDDRPWSAMDVTGRSPTAYVSIMQPETLRSFLGQERPLPSTDRLEVISDWQRLRSENAPFRVVGSTGLASAPVNYFDDWLIANAGERRSVFELIGEATARFAGQVGNVVLIERVATLAASGALIVHGDLTDIRSAQVSRPMA